MATTKKRQRKRKVYVCQKCGSPFSSAHTNKEYRDAMSPPPPPPAPTPPPISKPSRTIMLATATPVPKPQSLQSILRVGHNDPANYDYFVERKCLSCGDKHREDVPGGSNLINQVYEQLLDAHYIEMKSPFDVELKFHSIKVDKKTIGKASHYETLSKHGVPPFFAFCKDHNGLIYRFGGKSALEVIYGAVKDRWFTTRICIQKFVRTNKGAKMWHQAIGSEDTIQHWRQSPRIVDDIVLL